MDASNVIFIFHFAHSPLIWISSELHVFISLKSLKQPQLTEIGFPSDFIFVISHFILEKFVSDDKYVSNRKN